MKTATAYVLEQPGMPLVRRERAIPDPGPGEALVRVLACGLCHTDFGYARGGVPTRKGTPIVLGHEVVGRVERAGSGVALAEGAAVLVPAVLPCGTCAFCRAGRSNACPQQKMPGNDIDGGFATHLLVPAAPLVALDGVVPEDALADVSVVADAVSTAYQAARRAQVQKGDLVVVVGAGGVGGFLVQVASALGARTVAIDVKADVLERLRPYGANEVVNAKGVDAKDVRAKVRALAKAWEVPSFRLRVFEASGTVQGQSLAYALLDRAATLVLVGYTPDAVSVRLSNLMAFDATVYGTWGCPPDAYPEVLKLIGDGKIALAPLLERAPMSKVNELMDAMAAHALEKRMVLDPDA